MSPQHSFAPSAPPTGTLPLLDVSKVNGSSLSLESHQEKNWGAIDFAVALGIIGLLLALLIPTLKSQDLSLPSATRGLVESLRLTRAGAASRGTHFRVTLHPHSYAIEQLQDRDGDGVWDPDVALPAWRVSLPPTISISTSADTVIEFDGRGLPTMSSGDSPPAVVTIRLNDARNGQSEAIQIWPSGNVQKV